MDGEHYIKMYKFQSYALLHMVPLIILFFNPTNLDESPKKSTVLLKANETVVVFMSSKEKKPFLHYLYVY